MGLEPHSLAQVGMRPDLILGYLRNAILNRNNQTLWVWSLSIPLLRTLCLPPMQAFASCPCLDTSLYSPTHEWVIVGRVSIFLSFIQEG